MEKLTTRDKETYAVLQSENWQVIGKDYNELAEKINEIIDATNVDELGAGIVESIIALQERATALETAIDYDGATEGQVLTMVDGDGGLLPAWADLPTPPADELPDYSAALDGAVLTLVVDGENRSLQWIVPGA